eukprot:CAMPEP_0184647744 /NCGR_PEP_ID=MMETSP0308-20130426/4751_1 /TAXON_ID=38269 /ORGANISM="Gloeochaete witrockiana, Strain SAG 46.84" /LENGTH=265 /DNA_ID=CAMNT_0027078993 /DNA_START=202 /DNA_END=999 /DNA_ORIENTATION=+
MSESQTTESQITDGVTSVKIDNELDHVHNRPAGHAVGEPDTTQNGSPLCQLLQKRQTLLKAITDEILQAHSHIEDYFQRHLEIEAKSGDQDNLLKKCVQDLGRLTTGQNNISAQMEQIKAKIGDQDNLLEEGPNDIMAQMRQIKAKIGDQNDLLKVQKTPVSLAACCSVLALLAVLVIAVLLPPWDSNKYAETVEEKIKSVISVFLQSHVKQVEEVMKVKEIVAYVETLTNLVSNLREENAALKAHVSEILQRMAASKADCIVGG